MKRKFGLFKKAYELSVLCGCDIALVVFGPDGKLHEYSNRTVHTVMNRALTFHGPRETLNNAGVERVRPLEEGSTARPPLTVPVVDAVESRACAPADYSQARQQRRDGRRRGRPRPARAGRTDADRLPASRTPTLTGGIAPDRWADGAPRDRSRRGRGPGKK